MLIRDRPNNQRIGQILITLGITSSKEVSAARLVQMQENSLRRLGEIMKELGYVTEEWISRAMSIQHDLDAN